MTYYRLYFMDPESDRIHRFEEFQAVEETEAIARAEWACQAVPVELWSGRRKVRRLEPWVSKAAALPPGAVLQSGRQSRS